MIHTKPAFFAKNFEAIIEGFPLLLATLQDCKLYQISEYYKRGAGTISIVKSLGLSTDISGLYVFYKHQLPFYTGISGKIFRRIKQHVAGANHNSSSLCYKLGAAQYVREFGLPHEGGRGGLNFEQYGSLAKEELLKCSFRFIQIENDVELYLFEAYVAMQLGTMHYNQFKTH